MRNAETIAAARADEDVMDAQAQAKEAVDKAVTATVRRFGRRAAGPVLIGFAGVLGQRMTAAAKRELSQTDE